MNKGNNNILFAIEKGYKIGEKGDIYYKNNKINLYTSGSNYYRFSIRNESGQSKSIKVHRLQAYEKYGNEVFKENIVVRHLNGDSLDNSWDNIKIGTHSDNKMDIPKENRIKSATTASRKMQDNIRTYDERCLIYEDLKNNIPYKEVMLKHNISSKGTLSFMKNKSIEYKEYL